MGFDPETQTNTVSEAVSVSRRSLLQTLGVGAVAGTAGLAKATSQSEFVFVQPSQNGPSQAAEALRDNNGAVRITYDNFDFVAGTIPGQNRRALAQDNRVAFVEDDAVAHALHHKDDHNKGGGGDDDGGGCSDHPAQDPSWGWERINAGAVSADGTGADIAILDTGIDTDHCDLTVAGGQNCTRGNPNNYDDKNGHGTHCAGIATADNNGIGVRGVAPNANVYAVKVLDNSGSGYYSWIAEGIDWCISNNVEIISMSLGGSSGSSSVDSSLRTAYSNGHLPIAAAGNDGNNEDGHCEEQNVSYPARNPDVMAISAMDSNDSLAGYSSVGDKVELMAPGTDIRSTYEGDSYNTLSGTSMACPHVSGVAGLLWDVDSSDEPGPNDSVRSTLKSEAETVLGTCEEGSGLVDADAAVSNYPS